MLSFFLPLEIRQLIDRNIGIGAGSEENKDAVVGRALLQESYSIPGLQLRKIVDRITVHRSIMGL